MRSKPLLTIPRRAANADDSPLLPRVVRLVLSRGRVLVATAEGAPVAARVLAGTSAPALLRAAREGREALAVFDGGDPSRPVIVGVVDPGLSEADALDSAPVVVDDGEHVVIEGRKSVTLKCGKGSIEVREDGKVFVRGTHLVSRATGVNRIRGGAVRIN